MTIDIDEAKVEHSEIGLWFRWTLATAGGMLLGFLLSLPLVNLLNLAFAQIIVPVLAGTIVLCNGLCFGEKFLISSPGFLPVQLLGWLVSGQGQRS